MSCPHALHGSPARCSQCLGAEVTVRARPGVPYSYAIDPAARERSQRGAATKKKISKAGDDS